MSGDGYGPPHPAHELDPVRRLWEGLPPQWRGPVLGPGIEEWSSITENGDRKIDLRGLPDPFSAELAWMAHWQAVDGTRCSVHGINQLANMLRRAILKGHPIATSMRTMDWEAAWVFQRWFYASRWGRLPNQGSASRLRIVFRFARLALLARCHDGPWWSLDEWHPRCDPRIPLSQREPVANYGCSPGQITVPWLREAAKWHLGTALEAGTLRWTTISQERLRCLRRFDKWITSSFRDPGDVLGDPAAAPQHAAAFSRWTAERGNWMTRPADRRHFPMPVPPRQINDDLRAVGELFGFIAANSSQARDVIGPSPWDRVTDAHTASWFRQVFRIPRQPTLNDRHYIDDHALGQIPAALPLMGLRRDQQMQITRGDGQNVTAAGLDDPQAMRMILLQILTGRRSSEIRTCAFDCLTPVTETSLELADGHELARFQYAQSKIDIAPDTILVDREVTAVIREQQQWIREQFPGINRRFLFAQRTGNRTGDKAYPSGTYNWVLREFSKIVMISDSSGQILRLSNTHRFRHSKLTRLAELGLPIHVLQRYAGHATPTMSMHYIAQRQEHAEQAFLATTKLRADGTNVTFSREDHDSAHLFARADRQLPNGACLLPPLQTCDKGNACLTCSVFITDQTHKLTLARQLQDTEELIERNTAAFQARHDQPMPQDNVWLRQRRAEHEALTRLIGALADHPGGATQGGGCRTTATDPVPLNLNFNQHRRTRP